jgi:hypothetical protein
MDDGSLVVRFGKVGIEMNRLITASPGSREIPAAHGLCGHGKLPVGLAVFPRPEPDRPKRMLGHFINHRIRVAELPGQFPGAGRLSDQTQGEQSHFLGVPVVGLDQLDDLGRSPAGLKERQKPTQILGFQQWLNELNELNWFDSRQSFTTE